MRFGLEGRERASLVGSALDYDLAVQPGTPAARAGLEGFDQRAGRLGDVITHAEGKQVQSVADLAAILDEVGIGNEATLKVRRGRSTRKVQVTIVNISAPA